MSNLLKFRSTHSERLERWLGKESVEHLSNAHRGFPGHKPVAVAGVPGSVYVCKDGDFRGLIRAGHLSNAIDFAHGRLNRILRNTLRGQMALASAGFASFDELISESTSGGKKQVVVAQKNGTAGVVSGSNTMWFVGSQPVAGAAAAAAPGGTAPTSASTGAISFLNPSVGGDTLHFIGAQVLQSNIGTLLLCDRLFSVTKTMNSTATEAVTGVPTRYQSTVATNADYAGNNQLIIETRTVLPATAHNWTVCTYTDQSGNAGATLPSVVGNSANPVNRLDQPATNGGWWCPLAAGDTGIKALTQMQCSALVATGNIDFTIVRPIAYMPTIAANVGFYVDGIKTAFNLERIFDDACLMLLEVSKPASSATSNMVHMIFVAS